MWKLLIWGIFIYWAWCIVTDLFEDPLAKTRHNGYLLAYGEDGRLGLVDANDPRVEAFYHQRILHRDSHPLQGYQWDPISTL